MKPAVTLISLAVMAFGAYLLFWYDVPDAQAVTNQFAGEALLIIGCSGLLLNAFWYKRGKSHA